MIRPNAGAAGDYSPMPSLTAAHLIIGVAWLIAGVGLGIHMATSQDFLLRPVHAHANLVGWATNALFGCFYWLRGGPARRCEWLGCTAFNLGGAMMLAGLTHALITGNKPVAVMSIGTLLLTAGVLQMVVAIVRNLSARRNFVEVAHG